jgi:YD repeat-containing protein
MKKFLSLAGMLAVLFLSSCKKESSAPAPGPGPDPAAKLLKTLTKTAGGQTTVYTYTYDDTKRLREVRSADGQEITLITYDAAGRPVKVEETEQQFRNIYTYTWANNVPVSATFKSWEKHAGAADELIEDDVLTYTVAGGKVTKIDLHMLLSDDHASFNLTYNGHNLTEVADGNGFYKATFTYGSKRSPFPAISSYVLDQAGFSLLLYAKHEITSFSFDFPGTVLDKTVTSTFTYDAAGYPLTSNDGLAQYQYQYQ